MVDQEKRFLGELRLCGESNRWRIDARHTGAVKAGDGDGDVANPQGESDEKKSALPEEVKLSIRVLSGDRSIVDLRIDAKDRAIVLLQATVNAAREEQRKRMDAVRE